MSTLPRLDQPTRERWKRALPLVQQVFALAQRDGLEALLKFDGQRDNGKIYTLVIGPGASDGAARRANSDDIESLISGIGISAVGSAAPDEELADALGAMEAMARQGAVIALRMWHDEGTAHFEAIEIKGTNSSSPIHIGGTSLKGVAETLAAHGQQRDGHANGVI